MSRSRGPWPGRRQLSVSAWGTDGEYDTFVEQIRSGTSTPPSTTAPTMLEEAYNDPREFVYALPSRYKPVRGK
ncbi:hypothetical protein [Streptomyces spectabilis]|uniref:Uncharacterized protein n=1 Tax=Streptomyces spectabilis TaxID=68270 RepID=A0A7W8AMR1_STRST|nr:hypothetical protein [Streptomyces spectabilis]MBB5101254.1 hypothetical protein [Streptomyces spectabilis]GGV10243.1 hypothetical protein GCM10010245_19290 [Streptomyces spectabilis]